MTDTPTMIQRAVGGFMPSEAAQRELGELYRIARTVFSGQDASHSNRFGYAIIEFMKAHAGEPNVSHKWIYVWAVDNLGTITTGDSIPDPFPELAPTRKSKRRSRR